MEISDKDVERFAALFPGYEKAHTTFNPREVNDKGKATGKYTTYTGPATLQTFRNHLEGKVGLTQIMLMTDIKVKFGAIDYDVYGKPVNYALAEENVRVMKLPLVVCVSKSGGVHFYCLTKAPVPPTWMLGRLAEWTAQLGLSAKTELFPKQTARSDEKDTGNGINLPYFGDARPCWHDGRPLTLSEFLDYAESMLVDDAVVATPAVVESTLFDDGPPCLQTLEQRGGFMDGTKKDGMFDVMVFLRKRYPDDWADRADEYNRAMANLRSDELQTLVKSNQKKAYEYKCKLAPINAVCNRKVCRTRAYGVGAPGGVENTEIPIEGLTRYAPQHSEDDAFYAIEVNGVRIRVTHAQLYSKDEFNRACLSQANIVPIRMSPSKWVEALAVLLQSAAIVPIPEEASPTGQLWERVTAFITQQVTAKDKAGVLLGQPFREGDKVWFRLQDLLAYLDARRVPYKSPQMVWDLLKKKGAEKEFWNMEPAGVANVWGLEAPELRDLGKPTAVANDGTEAF